MARARWLLATSLAVTAHAVAAPGAGQAKPPATPDLPRPPREQTTSSATVVLPPVPAFEIPAAPAGTRSVRELRVAGRPLLDKNVTVSGYVTWIYDCVAQLRRPGEAITAVQARIDADPTQCERPRFYLGDTRDTPPERSLWVVGVPRPYNKIELERIEKKHRTPANYPDRCEPDPARPRATSCADLQIGDYVTVRGRFAQSSPHGERNSDGLIVLRSVSPAKPPTGKPRMKAVRAPSAKLAPLKVRRVQRPPASAWATDLSVRAANEAARAYMQKDYRGAAERYTSALQAWDGNHSAWYGLAVTEIARNDWRAAAKAMARAFELAPDEPMYALLYGHALYEVVIVEAREAAARRDKIPVAQAMPDLAKADFSRAEQLLRHAVQLDDSLWRAHYYLGRFARDQGRAQDAARALTKALSFAPPQPGPWVALGELYRRWDYPELAARVAEQGTKVVTGAKASDVWYVLAMAHDDRQQHEPAIAAFTRALELDPAHTKALFQRGQALLRLRRYAEAKRDLEAALASPRSLPEFAVQMANKMLADIAERTPR